MTISDDFSYIKKCLNPACEKEPALGQVLCKPCRRKSVFIKMGWLKTHERTATQRSEELRRRACKHACKKHDVKFTEEFFQKLSRLYSTHICKAASDPLKVYTKYCIITEGKKEIKKIYKPLNEIMMIKGPITKKIRSGKYEIRSVYIPLRDRFAQMVERFK